MKTIHIVKSRDAVIVNHANNTVDTIEPIRTDVDWVYVAPEDCEIKYKNSKGEYKTYTASEGDIIIKFYEYEYTINPIVIVKNNKWKENITSKNISFKKRDLENQLKCNDLCESDCCNCCGC